MGGGGIGFYPVSQWAKIDRFFKKMFFGPFPASFCLFSSIQYSWQ